MPGLRIFRFYRRQRKKFFYLYLLCFLSFAACSVRGYIPDSVTVVRGEPVTLGSFLPVTKTVKSRDEAAVSSGNPGSAEYGVYELECRLFGMVPVKNVTVHITEEEQVIPCGIPIGIYVRTAGVYVVDLAEIEEAGGGTVSPAQHILNAGDYITAVDGTVIETKEDLTAAVSASDGAVLTLTVRRGGETVDCEVAPVKNADGQYRIGVWVRDDMAGIGTLTYVTEDGEFGALGHCISDTDTGSRIEIERGTLYLADILSIIKGEKGNPGELAGQIRYTESRVLGDIEENREDGIFGTLTSLPEELSEAEPVSVGYKQEVEEGPAQILIELDGELKTYAIEIESVELNAAEVNKSIRFRVTDEELIEKTGGIIQGFSGVPILQGGKIIGAVTHVFVSNPREGCGIFIEDMMK
ncbi:MAG: SpoIVB peptidase [Lachnospiraceae bacterium]|nr:SpoIVB peptidase [Lachnospiraceae bacterium]